MYEKLDITKRNRIYMARHTYSLHIYDHCRYTRPDGVPDFDCYRHKKKQRSIRECKYHFAHGFGNEDFPPERIGKSNPKLKSIFIASLIFRIRLYNKHTHTHFTVQFHSILHSQYSHEFVCVFSIRECKRRSRAARRKKLGNYPRYSLE